MPASAPVSTRPSRWWCAAILASTAWGGDVILQAPLTTQVPCMGPVAPGTRFTATITVPAGAPADLGVGLYAGDRHGHWYQCTLPGVLAPGVHAIDLPFDEAPFVGEPALGAWSATTRATMVQAGLFFWAGQGGGTVLKVDGPRLVPAKATVPTSHALTGLAPSGDRIATGRRWTLAVQPWPLPANPFDSDVFTLDAVIIQPDGTTLRVPGFYQEPMGRRDRGDREIIAATGAGGFAVRFRPRLPGVHKVRLEARWQDGTTLAADAPPFTAEGKPWDGYVRVDAGDPRFLSRDGAFVWPLGPNLRSANDARSQECLQTRITPDRGSFTSDAYLARLAAHGVNAVEVWMCSWNLAFEWRADWPPFHGQGRYAQEHAWRLDQLLDRCEELGVGVILVFDNHGKGTTRCDVEWMNNPYNKECGGRLTDVNHLFTDAWAKAGQAKLRRYLVARYGDHPALMMWKLWSEISLLTSPPEELKAWHQQAAAHLHAIDPYRHPVTTHWHQDFTLVDRAIARLPELDVVAIDAYHDPPAPPGRPPTRSLVDLLTASLYAPERPDPKSGWLRNLSGLGTLGKPLLVTEFGGQNMACAPPQMEAEHASGPWAGLVLVYAGAPMLWWFEWLDQGGRFAPYRAVSRFIAGEDLRGKEANSVLLAAASPAGPLWCRAWARPGHLLGYVMDVVWGGAGGPGADHQAARVVVGNALAAGPVQVEWWNADTGDRIDTIDIQHPGGQLVLNPPAFRRHCAFKLRRTAPAQVPAAQ